MAFPRHQYEVDGWQRPPRLLIADRHGREIMLPIEGIEVIVPKEGNEPNTTKVTVADLSLMWGMKLPPTRKEKQEAASVWDSMIADVNCGPWYTLRGIKDWIEEFGTPEQQPLARGLGMIIDTQRWPVYCEQDRPREQAIFSQVPIKYKGYIWTKEQPCQGIERGVSDLDWPAYVLLQNAHKMTGGRFITGHRIKISVDGITETKHDEFTGETRASQESYEVPIFDTIWQAIQAAAFALSIGVKKG